MNRILVIRGGAIGDFVLTLPAIRLLRDRFPHARLEILGYKHIIALAEKRFYADAVRSLESGALSSFFTRGAELSPQLGDYFHGFDLVVSYLFDPDGIFEGNLRRCGVEEFLACSPKFTNQEHVVRQLARPLEQLGLSLTNAAARLYPSAEDRDFADVFLRQNASPIIALHPGSGSAAKNWPVENWSSLSEWLLESKRAAALLVIGGEADEKQLTFFHATLPKAAVRFAENLSLPHLTAVIEKCALFVGHDSGISHIAAAVGTKCVLLFGPSDPDIWAPMNSDVKVLRGPRGTIVDLPVDDVKRAISAVS